jgi:AraC-like DNA-binding protein
MMQKENESYTGDPSKIVQIFPKFDLQVLCCRYWWLEEWEHSKLSFPFWRLYSNYNEGAFIEFEHKVYPMKPDMIYLIPPNTDYSSRLYDHPIPLKGHRLTGGGVWGIPVEKRAEIIEEGAVAHLFIHFVFDNPYITVKPGIYEFPMDDNLQKKITKLRNYLLENPYKFNLNVYFVIQSVICSLLGDIDKENWTQVSMDSRIIKVQSYIRDHINDALTNESLAELACLTPNALARLFKDEVGLTLQTFIRQRRIDKACSLFLHTDLSIDQVASRTGFSNRYHFTRIFREITDITPAKYKKNYML